MKKFNIKKPKYIIPLIILPFLFLGFYLFKENFETDNVVVVGDVGLQENISDVSDQVKTDELHNKLEAFQSTYKNSDGYTAINSLGVDEDNFPAHESLYSDEEKRELKALEDQLKGLSNSQNSISGYNPLGKEDNEDELLKLFMKQNEDARQSPYEDDKREEDPMRFIKEQYRMMDSLEKAHDPDYQKELKRIELQKKAEEARQRRKLNKLTVQRNHSIEQGFNTIIPTKRNDFIKAIIDENVQGYAGSRIRIRLLEDIKVGKNLITKGTYLYALISGFSEQRVKLKIVSVMYHNKILPINLDIYDMDGMEGLYVPDSAFREFTKDLGAESLQGQGLDSSSQDFLMSSLQKAFQSTSQAIASAIRKNKAKLKYNSFVFLIDMEELQEQNNNY